MAKIEGLMRHILKWECGASDKQLANYMTDEKLFYAVRKTTKHPSDPGGWTNSGVTLATFKRLGCDKDGDKDIDLDDLRLMDYDDWKRILQQGYWGKALADRINSQSVANMIVDWMFTSGGAAKQVQKAVGATPDGVFGNKTIAAINALPPYQLWVRLKQLRLAYYKSLSSWKTFGRGWTNRVNDLKYIG